MARTVPADLEDALAASPAARERFWAMPSEQKDSWVAYVERSRFPGARRRRVAETVRRLGGRRAVATAEQNGGAVAMPLPRNDWALWLVGLALLAGLAALLLWLFVFRDRNDSTPASVVVTAKASVPKVTGIRYQAAQFQLKEAKLASKLTRRNASKPKGIVVAQAPKKGKSVPEGTVVVLVVSKGPPGVAMPDLTGLAAADAIRALRSRKLVPSLQQTASTQPPGTVLAQEPKPGKRAKPGTKVVLQVAKGVAAVAVPDVTGSSQQNATSMLRAAGLTARAVQVPATTPAGTVVAQSPAAGQKLARGSAVRLNVSKGGASTSTTQQQTTTSAAPAPPSSGNDYTGMRLGAAVQKIVQGRQQVIVEYVTSSKPAGVVVASSTAGSRVRLQVSGGAQPKAAADVPDVTSEDAASAQQDLEAAGFTVVQAAWPVSDPSRDGVVTYQTPSGGAQAPSGSAVVVYVGSATSG